MKLDPLAVQTALENAGMRQSTLADKIEVTRSAVSRWLQGKSGISSEKLGAIAAVLNVSPSSLVEGDAPTAFSLLTCGTFTVKEKRLSISDETGEPFWEETPNGAEIRYATSTLERYEVEPDQLNLAKMDGDAMSPTIQPTSLVLWIESDEHDPEKAEIRDGGIYVLGIAGRVRIRRVRAVKDGILVYGDKDSHEPERYLGDDLKTVRIYGRVVEATQFFEV